MIAVIDIGTTSCKTSLFNEKGRMESIAYKEYNNIYLSSTTIEQNPKVWFNSVLKTMSECIKNFSGTYEIEAIIVTSQRATIIPINKKGDFLRNAILWLDKRSISECEFIRSKIGEDVIYKKTGLRIDPYFSAPKILWIKNNQPDIYNNTYKFLTVHDYIIYNLTGEIITDQTQASRTMLFNIDKFCWDNEIFECLEIDQDKFPQVIITGTIIGELKNDIAKKIGFPKGIPVLAGGGDQQLAAIGLGAIEEGKIGVTTGGGSFIVMHSNKSLRDKKMRVLCSNSTIPNKWILEGGILTTGSIYKWFKDVFGQNEIILSKELKKSPYEIFDMEIKTDNYRQPSGLILLPHFAGSAAPYWNSFARGVLFNLTFNTSRRNLIKAILESICLEVKKIIIIFEELIEKIIEEVYVGGGLSKSDLFNQLQADIYGKPVIKASTSEVVSHGAAMIGLTKLGLYKDLNECISNIVKIEKKIIPNCEITKKYDAIMRISEEIYNALEEKDLYRKAFKILNSFNV